MLGPVSTAALGHDCKEACYGDSFSYHGEASTCRGEAPLQHIPRPAATPSAVSWKLRHSSTPEITLHRWHFSMAETTLINDIGTACCNVEISYPPAWRIFQARSIAQIRHAHV